MSEREGFTPSDAENFKAGSDNPFERKGPKTAEGVKALWEESNPREALEKTGAKTHPPGPHDLPPTPEREPYKEHPESTKENKPTDAHNPGFAGDPTQGTGDATSDDNASDGAATDDAAGDTQDT